MTYAELAHWFYLDFYCIENPELHTCGIKDFSSQIFRHCPFLNQYAEEVDKRLEDWKQYKMSVPTYGAIILDPEIKFCLLVQGYWAKSSWGFPKGKINEEETEQECAVREVFEETGFNISELINATDYIENQMYDQLTRLYIIAGVSLDTKFQTKTRKEIKCMQWFPVDALPAHKKDQTCRTQLNMNSNNFFTVIPFIKPLRKWIANKKQQNHDLKSQLVGKVDMSGVIAPGPVNGNLTPVNGRQLTDKQRLKQQQSYNQQVFADFHEYQKLRDGKSSSLLGVSTGNGFKGSGNKMLNNGCNSNNSSEAGSHLIMTDSNNSHKFHKNRHSASPKQNYKKILSRDKMKESDSGLLGFCLHDLELNKATAWSNFRLNLEAIWTGLP